MSADILLEHADRVVSLTLDRQEALNAITPGMLDIIERAIALGSEDPATSALVLRARGRAFCSGADLKAARARAAGGDGGRAEAAFLDAFRRTVLALRAAPFPVIASVQGLAIAAGIELVLACDLVVAAESARFGDAHANYGLLPGGGGSVLLPRRIGVSRAKYLAFTGEFLPAATLHHWGLVDVLAPDEALQTVTAELLERLRSKSPLGLRRMKRLIDDGLEQPVEVALRNELVASAAHRHSEDRNEGLAAFAEKRRPVFKGV